MLVDLEMPSAKVLADIIGQLKREDYYLVLKYKKQVKIPDDKRVIRWNYLRTKWSVLSHANLL